MQMPSPFKLLEAPLLTYWTAGRIQEPLLPHQLSSQSQEELEFLITLADPMQPKICNLNQLVLHWDMSKISSKDGVLIKCLNYLAFLPIYLNKHPIYIYWKSHSFSPHPRIMNLGDGQRHREETYKREREKRLQMPFDWELNPAQPLQVLKLLHMVYMLYQLSQAAPKALHFNYAFSVP